MEQTRRYALENHVHRSARLGASVLGAISPEGGEILKIIGRVRCNVVISGGTGSGKTTLLNCMTNYIGDCLRVIAAESAEPVRGEFRQIVEAQAMGLSASEAVERIVERVPIAELLRDRHQRSAKGRRQSCRSLEQFVGGAARSQKDEGEDQGDVGRSQGSAYIIDSMPFLVTVMVWFTSPKYMELLWTTQTGELVLGACVLWMGIGIVVMKNMIYFDI